MKTSELGKCTFFLEHLLINGHKDIMPRALLALISAWLMSTTVTPWAFADETVEPRLFAVPVLEPGKAAWVSVYDQFGRPIPHSTLLVNDSAVEADNMGQASFTVPDSGTALTLSVRSADGQTLNPAKYTKTSGGYYVASAQAAEAVDRIEESVVSNEQAPNIAYAPSVIETSQAFVLMGKNWSGKADGDHILVDGYDADVFSGSSVCLLATTPRRMSVGPLREMYVTTGAETSNTVEVDVCRLEVSKEGDSARVKLLGTNVPSLVDVRNMTPNAVTLTYAGKELGRSISIITSGGEQNFADVGLAKKSSEPVDLDAHLVADAPWSPDDRTTYGDTAKRKIVAQLNKSEVIRLKRRLIAIEQHIGNEQEKRTKGLEKGSLTSAEVDRINAQLRTLSNRQRRINAMVVARRAVFQSLGGTEQEYRQALDVAAGGGAIALEKCLAPLTCASMLASTSPPEHHQLSSLASLSASQIDQAINIDREKEIKELAELQRLWKQLPTKVAHGTRLAPPPPPYIPNLEGDEVSYDFKKLVRLGAPPPPPPLMALMRKHQASLKHGHGSTRASQSRTHARPKSRSRGR
jgi:hypothetical protein